MDINQLQYFKVIAKYENISKASLELNVAQPALSLTIKKLESYVGYPLFKRKGKHIYLNNNGKIFLESINNIFIEINNFKSRIKELNDIEDLNLNINSSSSLILVGILKNFLIDNPDIKVSQSILNRTDIIKNLKEGLTDIALSSPPIYDNSIETIDLLKDELVLIVNVKHHLSSCTSVTLNDLKNENFIELSKNHSFSDALIPMFNETNFKPNVVFEGDINMIRELISINKGIAIAPISATNTILDSNLKVLEIKEKNNFRTISLSFLKSKYKTKSINLFINYVVSNYLKYI